MREKKLLYMDNLIKKCRERPLRCICFNKMPPLQQPADFWCRKSADDVCSDDSGVLQNKRFCAFTEMIEEAGTALATQQWQWWLCTGVWRVLREAEADDPCPTELQLQVIDTDAVCKRK